MRPAETLPVCREEAAVAAIAAKNTADAATKRRVAAERDILRILIQRLRILLARRPM
jgi:hypothetical protein